MSLLGEDRFVYIRSALFTSIKCVSFSRNACIFKISDPRPHPHHFSKLIFHSKIWNFTVQIKAYQEGTKSKHWSEWTSSQESRYVLEYKAPLISIATNPFQPSPITVTSADPHFTHGPFLHVKVGEFICQTVKPTVRRVTRRPAGHLSWSPPNT